MAYLQPIDPSIFKPNQFDHSPPAWALGLYLLAWIAPAIPLVIAGLALMGMRQIPTALAKVLAGICIVTGFLLTFLGMIFSLGSDIEILHGVTLTIAVTSSILIWSGSDEEPQPSRLAKLGVTLSTIVALWSILTIPMIHIQARDIADGSPFCIAKHAPTSRIETLRDLRGFSFYTTKTGYKSTSEWYFHGLMIVDRPDKQSIYNWSPRRWRFDLVEREDMFIETVRNVCVPS